MVRNGRGNPYFYSNVFTYLSIKDDIFILRFSEYGKLHTLPTIFFSNIVSQHPLTTISRE